MGLQFNPPQTGSGKYASKKLKKKQAGAELYQAQVKLEVIVEVGVGVEFGVEPKVRLTSNQAVRKSLYIVYRSSI